VLALAGSTQPVEQSRKLQIDGSFSFAKSITGMSRQNDLSRIDKTIFKV
jgi:hypothetical protein